MITLLELAVALAGLWFLLIGAEVNVSTTLTLIFGIVIITLVLLPHVLRVARRSRP